MFSSNFFERALGPDAATHDWEENGLWWAQPLSNALSHPPERQKLADITANGDYNYLLFEDPSAPNEVQIDLGAAPEEYIVPMMIILKNHTDKIKTKTFEVTSYQGYEHYRSCMNSLEALTLKSA